MFSVFGFYKFKKIKNLKKIKNILNSKILHNKIRGTIIISKEGINGTLSGKINNLSKMIKLVKKIILVRKFDSENLSKSKFNPFHRAKIKVKNEVVPMGFNISSYKKTKSQIVKATICECLFYCF